MDIYTQEANALGRASLILTALAINIQWFLWDIPLPFRHGYRAYLHAVIWECIRITMPSVAGIFALYNVHDRSLWPKAYYFGGHDDALYKPMTWAQVLRVVMTDLLNVAACAITVISLCQTQGADKINMSLWAYPALPPTLIGLWITIASRIHCIPRRVVFIGGYVVLLAVGIVGIPLALSLGGNQDAASWLPATVLFFYMSLPFDLSTQLLVLVFVALGTAFTRVVGLAVNAMVASYYFPVPEIQNPAFGVVYLIVGLTAAGIAAQGRTGLIPLSDNKERPERRRQGVERSGSLMRTFPPQPLPRPESASPSELDYESSISQSVAPVEKEFEPIIEEEAQERLTTVLEDKIGEEFEILKELPGSTPDQESRVDSPAVPDGGIDPEKDRAVQKEAEAQLEVGRDGSCDIADVDVQRQIMSEFTVKRKLVGGSTIKRKPVSGDAVLETAANENNDNDNDNDPEPPTNLIQKRWEAYTKSLSSKVQHVQQNNQLQKLWETSSKALSSKV
ncbi:hypothetical protein AJ80_04496 [Polytolypa hystricis UAMH7299]|uniref:Uncharacterized protein n=1 Tax=Polytolypa hystricis (strain UAMH7299) TaxID=1447883 RepID=A0A2B7YBM7_POLH7|nr:hypothetical protein AJ80_04496 [Polytolypa hystricis UAMH7299]